jgi:integrase
VSPYGPVLKGRVADQHAGRARDIADQLGHSKVSTTQDVYMGRRVASRKAADALEAIIVAPP